MSRVLAAACLLLSGCITNTQSTQNAQIVPVGGAGMPAPAPRPAVAPARAPTLTSTARIAGASLVTVSKTTTSGARLTLATPQALARDCTPLGRVEVKVMAPPDHGTIHVETGSAFSNYVPGDPPFACNARKSPATVVTYQAEAGFSGEDVAVVQIFFPDGRAPQIRFNIAVR